MNDLLVANHNSTWSGTTQFAKPLGIGRAGVGRQVEINLLAALQAAERLHRTRIVRSARPKQWFGLVGVGLDGDQTWPLLAPPRAPRSDQTACISHRYDSHCFARLGFQAPVGVTPPHAGSTPQAPCPLRRVPGSPALRLGYLPNGAPATACLPVGRASIAARAGPSRRAAG